MVAELALLNSPYAALMLGIYGGPKVAKAVRNSKAKKAEKKIVKGRNIKDFDEKTGLFKKNKPMTQEEDAKVVNPFRDKNITGTDNNCAYCSTAYELRRRGFDVIADRTNEPKGTEEFYTSIFVDAKKRDIRNKTCDFYEIEKRGEDRFVKWTDNKKKKDKHISLASVGQNEEFAKSVISTLKKSAKNSRGFVTMNWAFGGSHVVNYEVKGGKLTLIDSQVGKVYNEKEAIEILSNAWGSTYYRLDNSKVDYKKLKGVVI